MVVHDLVSPFWDGGFLRGFLSAIIISKIDILLFFVIKQVQNIILKYQLGDDINVSL